MQSADIAYRELVAQGSIILADDGVLRLPDEFMA